VIFITALATLHRRKIMNEEIHMATLPTRASSIPAASLKNILFVTDFSDASMKALPHVELLAKKFQASVFVCHMITPSSLVAAAPQAAPYLYEAEYNAAAKELDNILHGPRLAGMRTKALLPTGMLGDTLVEEIKENHVDLVVAGTHGRTGFRRFLLGSAAEEICRAATCPVLTVGPELPSTATEFRRILIPTDLSVESMRCLPFVVRLASEYSSAITILHVLPEETAYNPDAKKLSEPVRKTMVHTFEPQLGTLKAEFVTEAGETADTILRVAREKGADLIAMGIRNAFLPGLHVRASVAYRVMSAAECPVMTCR
jgi:nucleotide-binding universal stress UspA family protein